MLVRTLKMIAKFMYQIMYTQCTNLMDHAFSVLDLDLFHQIFSGLLVLIIKTLVKFTLFRHKSHLYKNLLANGENTNLGFITKMHLNSTFF